MSLRVTRTPLAGLLVLDNQVFRDGRGHFSETYNARELAEEAGIADRFVQDNESVSVRHVLRGMHFQRRNPQGKIVRVVAGAIFDATIDMRRHSSTFGQWFGMTIRAEEHRQLWIPPGFAHGFLVLSDTAHVLYKTTAYRDADSEGSILWNDAQVGIEWPLTSPPILSARDSAAGSFAEAPFYD